MKILTKKQLIADVPKRWGEQYRGWVGDKLEIHNQLLALGKNATEDDVYKIIGNTSWTTLICNSCFKDSDAVAVYDDGDCCSAYFCKKCLSDALESIDNAHNT